MLSYALIKVLLDIVIATFSKTQYWDTVCIIVFHIIHEAPIKPLGTLVVLLNIFHCDRLTLLHWKWKFDRFVIPYLLLYETKISGKLRHVFTKDIRSKLQTSSNIQAFSLLPKLHVYTPYDTKSFVLYILYLLVKALSGKI